MNKKIIIPVATAAVISIFSFGTQLFNHTNSKTTTDVLNATKNKTMVCESVSCESFTQSNNNSINVSSLISSIPVPSFNSKEVSSAKTTNNYKKISPSESSSIGNDDRTCYTTSEAASKNQELLSQAAQQARETGGAVQIQPYVARTSSISTPSVR